jgi:membrane fusion protein, multidrug efflux system
MTNIQKSKQNKKPNNKEYPMWIFWAAVAIIIILILSYILKSHKKTAHVATHDIQTVTTKPLTYHIIPLTVTGYGKTRSPDSVQIKSTIAGRVAKILFKAGDKVKKNGILFVLTNTDIDRSKMVLKADLYQAKQEYDRYLKQQQLSKNSLSEMDLIKSETNYKSALSKYNKFNELNNIRSPINGIVTNTELSYGSYVAPGDPLVNISVNKLQIEYILPSKYIKTAKTRQDVSFSINNNIYKAKVSYVSPEVNLNSRGITLRADFINAPEELTTLAPNMFGKITQIINPTYKTLAIDQSFVQSDPKGFFIYSLDHNLDNNKIVKDYFVPAFISKNGLIAVSSGLNLNEIIITTDPDKLTPGQKVKIKI